MDTSSWRVRVLLEPRGFIRFLEFILAIIAFATTGGYSGQLKFTLNCNATYHEVSYSVDYPFKISQNPLRFQPCDGSGEKAVKLHGDFSPSAQWFMFVGVTAFLYALASIIFYVAFDSKVRANHEKQVTVGDLIGTVLYAFFWLTAASAWAWGLGEVKNWTSRDIVLSHEDLKGVCSPEGQPKCSQFSSPNYGPLNASVAFGFLNFFLWSCNVWFVYKESPFHQEPAKDENFQAAPEQSIPPNNM